MSRLDDEYDQAEHHDLKRVDEVMSVTGTRVDHVARCWCNWTDPHPRSSYAAAYQAHDRHRADQE